MENNNNVQESAPQVETTETHSVDRTGDVARDNAYEQAQRISKGLPSTEDGEVNIDNLIKLAEQDDQMDNVSEDGASFDEVYNSLDEKGKAVLKKLRADYTRKTQSLSEQRKKLEAQEKALVQSEAYQAIKQMAEQETGEFDPYNPDSFIERIRTEVAKQVAEMYKPVEEEYKRKEARVSAQSFIESKPEFKDDNFKKEVKNELINNDRLNLEEAYWIVKGRTLSSKASEYEQTNKKYKEALSQAGMSISTGRRASGAMQPPDAIRKQGGAAVYEWLMRNKGK